MIRHWIPYSRAQQLAYKNNSIIPNILLYNGYNFLVPSVFPFRSHEILHHFLFVNSYVGRKTIDIVQLCTLARIRKAHVWAYRSTPHQSIEWNQSLTINTLIVVFECHHRECKSYREVVKSSSSTLSGVIVWYRESSFIVNTTIEFWHWRCMLLSLWFSTSIQRMDAYHRLVCIC